jgi:hypothetical protein
MTTGSTSRCATTATTARSSTSSSIGAAAPSARSAKNCGPGSAAPSCGPCFRSVRPRGGPGLAEPGWGHPCPGRHAPLKTHRYLEEERAIPRDLLSHPRFAGRILVDARSNVVFPHVDRDGPCGFEIKNRNFTGFAPGGEKGLWISVVKRTDTTLVIAESAIDALSYAALHPDEHARYASFGGAMNPSQPALIRAAIERLSLGAVVRIATDNDEEGAGFAAIIERAVSRDGQGALAIERAAPADAKDWNEALLRVRRPVFFFDR